MGRLSRLARVLLSLPFAVILIVWGIPGMIEDLVTWSGWLANAWNWLTKTPTPLSWALVIIGVIIAFQPQWLLKRRASYSSGKAGTKVPSIPPRLKHDGVLWEDRGDNYPYGSTRINGPLCPKDYTPLGIKYSDRIDTLPRHDTLISGSPSHHKLICPECKAEYTLGDKSKTIERSKNEVESRFEGKRRRDESNAGV